MAKVNSVCGPIDTANLGFTLAHEHILVDQMGFFRDYPELFGDNVFERIVNDLKEAKKAGIDTVVDATTVDLGRDVKLLHKASHSSGVNIIACTGWWLNVPDFFTSLSPDRIAGWFIREIEQGISGTDIKAGILKSASDVYGVTPGTELILRAVAKAHLQTGVPIELHSYPLGQVGRQQLAVLKDEGVDPRSVKLDHSNDTTDVGYLTWIMEQGCYLGMDRYPGENVSPLDRTITMKALIDAGYAGRICPSHDFLMSYIQTASPEIAEAERLRANPHGLLYLKNVVFPKLRELGVSETVMDDLCVDGPRNFFEGI